MTTIATETTPDFIPWDIEVARINFNATCGPSSFAAITQNQVCRVMRFFPHFEHHQSTNLTEMKRAFYTAGYQAEVVKQAFPKHGLALIQFLGPWTEKHFFSKWSLIHTHWVAVHGDWIFDHTEGRWMTTAAWDYSVGPAFVAEISRATGWAVKFGIEVNKLNSHCLDGSVTPWISSLIPRSSFSG